MKKRLGVQLYSLRNFLNTKEEIFETLKKVKDMGYDSVQVCFPLASATYKEMGELIEKTALEVCGIFDSLPRMLDEPDELVRDAAFLKTDTIGLGYAATTDEASVSELICKLKRAEENLSGRGMIFHYHHHHHEFMKLNGKIVLERLMEETKMNLCLDTYWVQMGGGDIRMYLQKYADKIDTLHLKDYKIVDKTPRFAAIGDGNLNWDGIFQEAFATGINNYIVEQDEFYGEDPFNILKESRKFLEQYL